MTLFGVDLSSYQADFDIGQMQREGFEFIIAKISEGSYYRDSWWPSNLAKARAAALPIMGYHFLTNEDVQKQADLVASHIGDPQVPIALDIETPGEPDLRPGINDVYNMIAALQERRITVRLLYLPKWYWNGYMGSPDLNGLPSLWSSSYPASTETYASAIYESIQQVGFSPYSPGQPAPVIWQFTDTASVADQRIDANAFRGTPAELAALFTIVSPSTNSQLG